MRKTPSSCFAARPSSGPGEPLLSCRLPGPTGTGSQTSWPELTQRCADINIIWSLEHGRVSAACRLARRWLNPSLPFCGCSVPLRPNRSSRTFGYILIPMATVVMNIETFCMTVLGELACRDAPSQYELSSHGALSRTPLGKLNFTYRRLSYRLLSYRRLSYALYTST